jgi:predicted DNA-binding ribbon-helix-helix protein
MTARKSPDRHLPPGRPKESGTRRTIRLSELTWDRLRRIAAREGLDHGGVPSEVRAIAWLAERSDRAGQ